MAAGCADDSARAYAEAQTAQTLLNQGDLVGARQAITRAMALRDDQLDILLLDAQIKSRSGELRAAYDAYRMVLAIDPRQPEALLAVAQLGLGLGEERRSVEAIETVLSMMPGNPDALLLSGIHALNRKDYTAASALADELLANDPNDRRGIVLKARALALTDRREEALALLRTAAETIGNDQLIAIALLENARDEGDVPIMLEQFSLLRQARPDSIDLAIDEANVRYKSGDRERARAVGVEILSRFGNDAGAMRRLRTLWQEYDPDPLAPEQRRQLAEGGAVGARLAAARHYLAQGRPQVAETIIAGANDARAVGLMGRIAVAANTPGSIATAASIIARDKTNCDALAAAAEWNLAQRKPKEAIEPAQKVAAECRDSSDGHLLLARAYAEQGRAAGAERVFREGLAAHPDDYALTAAYAHWLLRARRADAAEAVAERLTDRAPQRLSSWRLLEVICTETGDNACLAAARRGMEAARKDFGIDLPPGERASNPLLGQQWR